MISSLKVSDTDFEVLYFHYFQTMCLLCLLLYISYELSFFFFFFVTPITLKIRVIHLSNMY